MTVGGIVAGFTVALGAGLVARSTELKEDASLAAFYLVSLALGVLILSLKGSNIDLLHILFGSVLALDDATLVLIAGIATGVVYVTPGACLTKWFPEERGLANGLIITQIKINPLITLTRSATILE